MRLSTTKIRIGVALLALLGLLASGVVPAPGGYNGGTTSFRVDFAFSTLYATFYFSAALIFLFGLRGFTRQLRNAYAWIAAGIALIAVTFIQVVVLSALNLLSNLVLTSAISGLAYAMAGIFVYVGARKFASLVGASSVFRSPWLVVGMALVGAVAIALTPRFQGALDAVSLVLLSAISLWIGGFMVAAAVLVLSISRHIGALYKPAMSRLFVAMFCSCMEIFGTVIYYRLGLDGSALLSNISIYGVIDPLITLAGIMYVVAAISFIETKNI